MTRGTEAVLAAVGEAFKDFLLVFLFICRLICMVGWNTPEQLPRYNHFGSWCFRKPPIRPSLYASYWQMYKPCHVMLTLYLYYITFTSRVKGEKAAKPVTTVQGSILAFVWNYWVFFKNTSGQFPAVFGVIRTRHFSQEVGPTPAGFTVTTEPGVWRRTPDISSFVCGNRTRCF